MCVSRRYRQEIIVARVDADAVVQRLGKPGFGDTVTLHAEHVETDDHAIAVAIPVTGGKVAIDAAPDILAGSLHGNFFGHIEASIALDMHIDPVIENAFFGMHRRRRDQSQCRDQAPHHGAISTRTAGRAASCAWKNSADSNANARAIRVSGTRCTASFKSRTAPL